MRYGSHPVETRNGIFWCQICRGQLKGKCIVCGQYNSKIREEFPHEVDHWKYIHGTIALLKKFTQATTGVPSVDGYCADCGLRNISTSPQAILEFKNEKYYAWLFANSKIFEIAETEQLAKIGLAIKAHAWQSCFSTNYHDYKWSNNSFMKPQKPEFKDERLSITPSEQGNRESCSN